MPATRFGALTRVSGCLYATEKRVRRLEYDLQAELHSGQVSAKYTLQVLIPLLGLIDLAALQPGPDCPPISPPLGQPVSTLLSAAGKLSPLVICYRQ